ncbi:hypothetical protein PAPHI01_0336 [Pancytospora philotis]|nr:hypothetical protein PAPHI01_0336 [Pancytospora philotis]
MIFVNSTLLLGYCLCSWEKYQRGSDGAEPYGDVEWDRDLHTEALDRALTDHIVHDDVLFKQYEEPLLNTLFSNCRKYSSINQHYNAVGQLMNSQGNRGCADVATCIGMSVLNEQYIGEYIEKITEKKIKLLVVLRKILRDSNALKRAASAQAHNNHLCNGGYHSDYEALIYARKYMAFTFVDQLISAELETEPVAYLHNMITENDLDSFCVYLQLKCSDDYQTLERAVTAILEAVLRNDVLAVYLDSFTIPFIKSVLSLQQNSGSPFYGLKETVTNILLAHKFQSSGQSDHLPQFRYIWKMCATFQAKHPNTQGQDLFEHYVRILSSSYENSGAYFRWALGLLRILSDTNEFSTVRLYEVLRDSEALARLPVCCVLLFVARAVPKCAEQRKYSFISSVLNAMASHQIVELLKLTENGGYTPIPTADYVRAMNDQQRVEVAKLISQSDMGGGNTIRREALGRIIGYLKEMTRM